MYTINEAIDFIEYHYYKQLEKCDTEEKKDFLNHKLKHTYGVYNAISRILYNDDEYKYDKKSSIYQLGLIGALYHDLGRFYQINKNGIVQNNIFEHGNAGYKILKDKGFENIPVLLSVKYHNKADISDIYTEEEYIKYKDKDFIINLLNLVRDADKFDNIEYLYKNGNGKVFTMSKQLEGIENEDNKLSNEVIESLLNGKVILYSQLKTKADDLVKYLGWLNDINYIGTKKVIREIGFKDFILKSLLNLNVSEDKIKLLNNKFTF